MRVCQFRHSSVGNSFALAQILAQSGSPDDSLKEKSRSRSRLTQPSEWTRNDQRNGGVLAQTEKTDSVRLELKRRYGLTAGQQNSHKEITT
jgi:hypothetical protein